MWVYALLYGSIELLKDGKFTGLVRTRHVNPTPADLGGVTSFLYELEHSAKPSLPALYVIQVQFRFSSGSVQV